MQNVGKTDSGQYGNLSLSNFTTLDRLIAIAINLPIKLVFFNRIHHRTPNNFFIFIFFRMII